MIHDAINVMSTRDRFRMLEEERPPKMNPRLTEEEDRYCIKCEQQTVHSIVTVKDDKTVTCKKCGWQGE